MPLECICMTYTTSNPECSFQIGMVWITIYPWMSIYDSFKMDEYSEHNMFKTSKQVTFQFPIRIDWMDHYCLDSNRLIWSPDKQTVAKRMSILFMWTWPECAVRSWPAMISSVTGGWLNWERIGVYKIDWLNMCGKFWILLLRWWFFAIVQGGWYFFQFSMMILEWVCHINLSHHQESRITIIHPYPHIRPHHRWHSYILYLMVMVQVILRNFAALRFHTYVTVSHDTVSELLCSQKCTWCKDMRGWCPIIMLKASESGRIELNWVELY